MRRTHRTGAGISMVGLAVMAALALAGCGDPARHTAVGTFRAQPASQATPGAEGPTPVSHDQYLAESTSMAEVGARLDPPPDGSVAVAESTARANLEKVVGPLPPSFSPRLASYTNTTYGDIQKDNSVKPRYTNVLVWAYVATDTYSGNGGASVGPDGTTHVAKLPPGTQCTAVWLVDATTGEYMMGYTGCPVTSAK